MLLYQTFAERRYNRESGEYIAYGLKVFESGAEGSPLKIVPDISVDRDAVVQLARKCTAGQLSLLHLEDVIEDFIS